MSAANPYLVNVRELVNRPGRMREQSLEFDVPEHFGEAVAVVTDGTPIRIDVRFESVHEGILATGDAETVAQAECARCLDPVVLPVRVDFQELFAYPASSEGTDFQVRDDHVDLEPVVRDAVVLALPFQPYCRPDCPGLDPATGERRPDGAGEPDAEVRDPRWAALEGFLTEAPSNEKR